MKDLVKAYQTRDLKIAAPRIELALSKIEDASRLMETARELHARLAETIEAASRKHEEALALLELAATITRAPQMAVKQANGQAMPPDGPQRAADGHSACSARN